MTVEFELEGRGFTAFNGGPVFTFNEAVSFQVACATQVDLDHHWDRLLEGGRAQRCGWLKDRFGVSWQVVPVLLREILNDPDAAKSNRAMQAMFEMRKFDIAALQKAYAG